MEEPPPPPTRPARLRHTAGHPDIEGFRPEPLPSAQPAVEVLIAVTVIGFVAAGTRRNRRGWVSAPAASFSPAPSASSQLSRRTNVAGPFQGVLAEGHFPGGSPRSGNQPSAIGVVRVEPNQQKIVKLLSALIAASAIVVMAVLAVALNEEQTGTGTGTVATEAGGGMSTGVTLTTTTPPAALPIPVAKPTMKAAVPKGFR
jgi:hypothetical protein